MALSEMSKDAPKEKKRVAKARERRLGTQRRQIERRRIRREKRYRNSARDNGLQAFVKFDWTLFREKIFELGDAFADLGRASAKPDWTLAPGRRGMSSQYVIVDESEFLTEWRNSELEITTRLAEKAAQQDVHPELNLKITAI